MIEKGKSYPILLTYSILIYSLLFIPAKALSWPSCPDWWPGCLDSGGTMAVCRYRCKIIKVSFDQKTTNRSHYTLTANCDWIAMGQAACPPSDLTTVTGTAWWDNVSKLAYENIHNAYADEFLIETVAKCATNPWTTPVDCTEIQRNVISTYPLPAAPISARQMSDSNRITLKQEENAATVHAQAPFFFQPTANATFEDPAKVDIKVRHLAQYPLEFEFQRKNLESQPYVTFPVDGLSLHTYPESGTNMITETVFQGATTGFYRIRARCQTANAQWSDYLHFSVAPTKAPVFIQPGNQQKFNKSAPIIVKAAHHPDLKVTFSFQWSPKQQPGEWPATPVDIEPTTTGWKSTQNGQTSCSYTFDKAGLYRVYAKWENQAALLSSQPFEIMDPSGFKNLPPVQLSAQYHISSKDDALPIKPSSGVPVERKFKMPDDGKKLSDKMGLAPALFLSGKKSYSPKENVMFALQGEPKGDPVIECSQDGLRWGTNCPKGIRVRKIGSGAQARYMVAASEPGRYRLKLGDVISEPFEVKPALGSATALPGTKSPIPSKAAGSALTPAVKTPVASSGPVSSVKTPAAGTAPKLVPAGAPAIRMNATSFTAPARVKFASQPEPNFKVRYVLEKKESGAFREIASSNRPEFDVAEPGDYRVKARYEGGASEAVVAFVVKSKTPAHPAPGIAQPLKTKIPAKTKLKP